MKKIIKSWKDLTRTNNLNEKGVMCVSEDLLQDILFVAEYELLNSVYEVLKEVIKELN